MATIGDVTIRIGATTRQLESDLKRAERALAQTGKKFSDLGAKLSLNLSLPIAAIGAASFKMASDVEESLNKVRVAFGNSSTEVEAFADTTLESFGIARGSALDMAALFGDMATSMGITQADAAKLSTSLVGLAGDLASFKNIALSEVQTALSGIFTGETESLKRLGVVMLETNLEAFALEQGIKKKYKTMTQAEKVALRYQFVLNATKNAQGDFARTSDGAANQMRIFQESLKEVGAQFGKVLLPIITPIINKFNSLLKAFANLSETQQKFIAYTGLLVATLGPLLSVIGSLVGTYGKLATSIYRLGVVTINTGTAAETTAFSFRKLALSLGPIAIALTVATLVADKLFQSLSKVEEKQSDIENLNIEAEKSILDKRIATERYVKIINDENKTYAEKKSALNKLNEETGNYFKGINLQKDGIKTLNELYPVYINNLLREAQAKLSAEKIAKIREQNLELEIEYVKIKSDQFALLAKTTQAEKDAVEATTLGQVNRVEGLADEALELRGVYNERERNLKSIQSEIDSNKQRINVYKSLIEAATDLNVTETGGGDGKESPLTKTLKGLNEELVVLERRLKAGLITPTEFASEKLQILEKRFEAVVDAGITGDLYTKYERDLYRAADSQDQLARSTEYFLSFANLIPGTFNVISQAVATNITEFDKLDNALRNKLISPVEYASQRIDLLKNTLRELSDKGLDETNPKFAEYKTQLDEAEASQEKYNQALQYTLQLAGLLPGVLNPVAQAAQKTSVQVNNIFDKLGQEFGPKVKELAEGIAFTIGSVFNTLGTIYDVQGQKLDAYEKKQRAAIENGYYNEEQKKKAIEKLEEDLAKKRTVLARKRALADKASAIFSATVNGANAVVQALNAPFGLGIPLAAIVGGLVAAQIAAIASAPLPSLAIGTDKVKSDGLAYLHAGEAVIPADVVAGGFSGSNGTQVYGRLSGIDLLLSNRYAGGYYNRLR